MPCVARSALQQFAIFKGVCRGHDAGHTVSAIAKQVGVSRDTVRARIRQFVDDGRGLDEFLDALRPPVEVDHKLKRKREKARERQREWQSRANGTAPALTSVQRMGRPRKRTPDELLDRLECKAAVGRESDRAHAAKVMRSSAADLTSGVHTSWTTAAVLSVWLPLDSSQRRTFDATGLTMWDIVPALLVEWGCFENADGVWINPSAANSQVIQANEDDFFGP